MTRFTAIKSVLMAVGVALAVSLWMLSGLGRDTAAPETAEGLRRASPPRAEPAPRVRVTVQKSSARTVTREIVVSARTEPNRGIELRAETDGRVVALGAERGAPVAAAERIVLLDMRDRNARLERARALVAQRELQYQAAMRLEGRQLVSEVQIAEAFAALESARAELETMELDLANIDIVAPFDAFVDERLVEIGDYVQSGDTIARLVDTDPLIVVGEVSEREISAIALGNRGTARLVDGSEHEGRVRYLAPVADSNTRTFRVELAVPNPGGTLRAGMTAQMRLASGEITAHALSPALLTLDDEGRVGLKAVNEVGRVEFYPVEIASSSDRGVLVTGLPGELSIITIGQGFVTPGQLVDAVPDPDAARQFDIENSGNAAPEPTTPRS